MAKRRQQLEASLESGAPPTGWRDKFQVGGGKKDTEYQRKTYLLEPEMVLRVAALAQREAVPINDLVRFLLGYALDEVESGGIELPVKVVTVSQRRLE